MGEFFELKAAWLKKQQQVLLRVLAIVYTDTTLSDYHHVEVPSLGSHIYVTFILFCYIFLEFGILSLISKKSSNKMSFSSSLNTGGPEVDCLPWVDAVLDQVDLSCCQISWQTLICQTMSVSTSCYCHPQSTRQNAVCIWSSHRSSTKQSHQAQRVNVLL